MTISKRNFTVLCVLAIMRFLYAQPADPLSLIQKNLIPGESVPMELLARKSILLYDPTIEQNILNQIQPGFQAAGIDAVLHYPMDMPLSNKDVNVEFVKYLNGRDIQFIIFLRKSGNQYEFIFAPYNKTVAWFEAETPVWKITGIDLNETLLSIRRTAMASQKKKNLLINEIPETELHLNPVAGNHYEFYAIDLRVDKLAIIKTGDTQADQQLEEFFKVNYPLAFTFFDAGSDEREIRNKGYLYLLEFIHCNAYSAMKLLGYDTSVPAHTLSSISFENGSLQIRALPASANIYKFYFKHLENGNIYLGQRWDASEDWMQALVNQIAGLKAELKIK
jgi:hypothetical protein